MSSAFKRYAGCEDGDLVARSAFAIRRKLAELETADVALQRMIDALGAMPNICHFIPAALQIVADALNTKNCSYYEHQSDDLIRLRYWLFNDHLFSPEQIADAAEDGLSLLRPQAQGFIAADSDLGSAVRQRSRACVIDHTRLDPPSIDTALCKARGWELELIVPLVVAGVAEGAVVVFRGSGDRWNAHEILLAERLAQPFALALKASRLAASAKEAAIVREREVAALRRADEVTRANDVMRATLERLSDEHDLLTFPSTILREAMRQIGSDDGGIFLFDPESQMVRAADFVLDPDAVDDVPTSLRQALPTAPDWDIALQRRVPVVYDLVSEGHLILPGAAEWHLNRGSLCAVMAPMFVNKEAYGFFGFCLKKPAAEVSQLDLGLLHALAQQATLAIQLTRLAEVSQKSAIALERQEVIQQERAHMAREIHDKLAQGYAAILIQQRAMRKSVDSHLDSAAPHLDIIEKISKEGLAEARRTMNELKSTSFEPGSLNRAVSGPIARWHGQTDFHVTLSINADLPPVPRYVETELSCVVAEALLNARRHARCTDASVTLERMHGKLMIKIRDQGIGFDVDAHGPLFGISSMHERAARAGADLEIASVLGHGTEVRIALGKWKSR